MGDYRLPDNEIFVLKRFHKTLKVKREADKVKAVYSLGSGYQVKVVADLLDLDEQTVRQYFLDYKNRNKKDRNKKQWVQLHYSGKESSLTNEQEQELIKHPLAAKIHVILDNATYYHSSEVMDWLSRHKKFKLHFLPPYSPNLNLIERLWKFFNEKVRNNRYYASFKQFTKACRSFFRCRKKWDGRTTIANHTKLSTNQKPMF